MTWRVERCVDLLWAALIVAAGAALFLAPPPSTGPAGPDAGPVGLQPVAAGRLPGYETVRLHEPASGGALGMRSATEADLDAGVWDTGARRAPLDTGPTQAPPPFPTVAPGVGRNASSRSAVGSALATEGASGSPWGWLADSVIDSERGGRTVVDRRQDSMMRAVDRSLRRAAGEPRDETDPFDTDSLLFPEPEP